MMKTFKQYLLEARAIGSGELHLTPIESSELVDFLKKHCSHSLSDEPRIWKGFYDELTLVSKTGAALVDLSKSERVSENTKNFYTALLDTSPQMRKANVPLRSKSLICSSSRTHALDYGAPNSLYCVFPYNGEFVGVAPRNDIWYTQLNFVCKGVSYTINFENANRMWAQMFSRCDITPQDSSVPTIIGAFKKLDAIISEFNDEGNAPHQKDVEDILESYFVEYDENRVRGLIIKTFQDEGLLNYLYSVPYNPKNCEISATVNTESIPSTKEVWLSGKAVLVSYKHWLSLKKELFNENI